MGNTRATKRQKEAVMKMVREGKAASVAMREAGYSEGTSRNPINLTSSKAFRELIDDVLPEEFVTQTHASLLRASKIEHMVFPTDIEDEEITDLLKNNGCLVQKIKHLEQGTHVWYFIPDGFSRRAGVDMAYKLRGSYAAEKLEVVDVNSRIKAIEEANKNDGGTKTRKQRVANTKPVQDNKQAQAVSNVSA